MGHLAVGIMRRMHERWHKEKLSIVDFNRVLDEIQGEVRKMGVKEFVKKYGLSDNVSN